MSGALILAVGYFLLGVAGLQLAISPGYASAIFPAAGLGLAAILHGGSRLLPGVWLGSFGINIWIAWQHGEFGWQAFFIAGIIALGAGLQVWLALVLVRYRIKHAWLALDNDSDIIWFLLLTGPLACLVSASWGNCALFFFQVIAVNEFAFNWWNWWVGDTLGVLLFAPLVLTVLQRGNPLWRDRLVSVAMPTLLVTAGILAGFIYVSNTEAAKFKQRVEEQGQTIAEKLQDKLFLYEELVTSLNNFIQAAPNFNSYDFEKFTRNYFLAHPDLQALSWNQLVSKPGRRQFEAEMSEELGKPGFQVLQLDDGRQLIPAAERERYVVVRYISPLEENRQAIGYDIASDAVRRSAIDSAMQSGKATLTAPIRLVQGKDASIGALLVKPVYLDHLGSNQTQPLNSPALHGFAVGVFNVREMLVQLLSESHSNPFGFVLEDRDAMDGEKLLYRSDQANLAKYGEFAYERMIRIGGRFWRLSIYPTPAFFVADRSLLAWIVLAAGLILASLLQAFLLAMTGRAAIIQRQVRAQTLELSRKEQFLRMSQFGGGIGTWEADLRNNKQVWSDNCTALLGCPAKNQPTWQDFIELIHPQDREQVINATQAHIEFGAKYDVEYRAIAADGEILWLRSTGQAERGGKPLIMRGIVQDVTERRLNQQRIQQLIDEQKAILESSLVGIATVRQRKILWANPAFERMLGYEKNELAGVATRLLYLRGDAYQKMAEAYADLDKGKIVNIQHEFAGKDGRIIWVDINGVMLDKESGVTLWEFVDITRRKQAETESAHSLSLVYATLESTHDAILVVDLHNTWVLHNQRFIDLWHIPEELIIAGNDTAALNYVLTQLEDAEGFLRKVRELYGTPEASSFDELKFKDGKIVERYSMPQWVDYQVVGRVWSFTDITDRVQSENAVKVEAEKNIALLHNASDGIHILDYDGYVIEASDSFCAMLGYARDEVIGMHVSQWDAKFIGAELMHVFRKQFAQKERSQFETRHRRKDGTIFEVEVSGLALELDGKPVVFNSSRDITQRKSSEQELRIAATVFESQEGMLVTDAGNRILRVNRAFCEMTGYSLEEVIGKNPRLLQSGRQDARFYQAMWDGIADDGSWKGEIWNRRKNGEIYPEHLTITAVKDEEGNISNYVATMTDITKSKAAADEIERLAYYDPLTGLPNRRLLLDRLKLALASSQRSGRKGGVLFIDMDNFKALNDTLGHDVGDQLLKQIAQRLESCVRDSDTVSRLGGDEFVVMLEDLSEQSVEAATQAEAIGDKVLATLNQPYLLGCHDHHSTPSIGAALFDGNQQCAEELLKQADIAMYQAKTSGRNALRFFDPRMQAIIRARMALERDLHSALAEKQFRLYFQQQVCDGKQICSAEVLIRWLHPARGLVSPADFIPLAEETGLIVPIGLWVLEAACDQIKKWESSEPVRSLQLAVNVSARQFRQNDFVEQVRRILISAGTNPNLLKLELTESLVIDDIEDTVVKMHGLREIGVRFSMDDFGTGYSSLSSLKKLPFDQLKIDQSFVRYILIDPDDAVIVQTIIAMANNLGMEVVAEGVETDAQRRFLLELGCPVCQGYLFGRPLPLDEFECLLKG